MVYDLWHKSRPQSDDPTCKEHGLVPSKMHGKGLRWQVRWDVYVNGVRRQEKRNFALKVGKDPEKHADAFDKSVKPEPIPTLTTNRPTIREVGQLWLDSLVVDESTHYHKTREVERWVYPLLGDTTVWDIHLDPEIIQRWIKTLRSEGLATGTVIKHKANLSSILIYAVLRKWIPENPMSSSLVTTVRPESKEAVPFTDNQLAEIQNGLHELYKPLVWIGSELGLRYGEMVALSPEDIQGTSINIQRQIKEVPGGRIFALPKRKKTRLIPLPRTTAKKLSHLTPARVTLPWGKIDGPLRTVELYLNNYGRCAFHRKTVSPRWNKALADAGITRIPHEDTFHKLRHTYASKLLSKGVDIMRVSACLGHKSVAFTLKTYCHLMPDALDSVRRAIDDDVP